ncbi:hypothetical protein Pint_17156 [Pistacia integerrima]|uniref:Uncharacterized protein n=1 Tax=Pistacia integerrima TaxID=434235 RepID=A0ACC0Z0T5_9ROSI|nr:hypothetical protein Pint_17156 [Pistacia integerrima]
MPNQVMFFSNLSSCLTEHWGDLPLKVDDSEDMIIYNSLRDAVNSGWSPLDFTATTTTRSGKKRKGLTANEAGLTVFQIGLLASGEQLLVT